MKITKKQKCIVYKLCFTGQRKAVKFLTTSTPITANLRRVGREGKRAEKKEWKERKAKGKEDLCYKIRKSSKQQIH